MSEPVLLLSSSPSCGGTTSSDIRSAVSILAGRFPISEQRQRQAARQRPWSVGRGVLADSHSLRRAVLRVMWFLRCRPAQLLTDQPAPLHNLRRYPPVPCLHSRRMNYLVAIEYWNLLPKILRKRRPGDLPVPVGPYSVQRPLQKSRRKNFFYSLRRRKTFSWLRQCAHWLGLDFCNGRRLCFALSYTQYGDV